MTYLIDGYNLLFRLGYATKSSPAPAFAAARQELLNWLSGQPMVADKTAQVRVVFDAVYGPFASGPSRHAGIVVEFSYKRTADEQIAELVEAALKPHDVTVVSDDNAVRDHARQHHVKAYRVSEFQDHCDELLNARKSPEERDAPEKPVADPGYDEELLKIFERPKP